MVSNPGTGIYIYHSDSDDHLKWQSSVIESYPQWQAKEPQGWFINGHPQASVFQLGACKSVESLRLEQLLCIV